MTSRGVAAADEVKKKLDSSHPENEHPRPSVHPVPWVSLVSCAWCRQAELNEFQKICGFRCSR